MLTLGCNHCLSQVPDSHKKIIMLQALIPDTSAALNDTFIWLEVLVDLRCNRKLCLYIIQVLVDLVEQEE